MHLNRVASAEEMRAVVLEHQPAQDALIFAAAVSDYRVRDPSEHKIKRHEHPNLTLQLDPNPDIAAESGSRKKRGQVVVVFAAETRDLLANAQRKLDAKHADLVVANDITEPGSGFESSQNRVTLLRRANNGHAAPEVTPLPLMDKSIVAGHIVLTVGEMLAARR